MKNAHNMLILAFLAPVLGLATAACGSSSTGTTTTGTTGTTGAGGSTGAGGGGPSGALELIDDMETPPVTAGQFGILANGGRVGGWFVYNDKNDPTLMMMDEPKLDAPHATLPNTMSQHALHVSAAAAFTGYGSGFGTNFNGDTAVYDGSAYSGIAFWAKSSTLTAQKIQLATPETDIRGGLCKAPDDPAATNTNKCSDDFYVTAMLTADWQEFTFPFSMFVQDSWGLHPTVPGLNPSKMYAIKFAQLPGKPFDVYVDDVSFVTK